MSKWEGNALNSSPGGVLNQRARLQRGSGLGSNIKRRAGGGCHQMAPIRNSPSAPSKSRPRPSNLCNTIELNQQEWGRYQSRLRGEVAVAFHRCTMSMSEPSSRARSIPSMTPFPAVLAETVSSQTLEALNDDILFSLSYAL